MFILFIVQVALTGIKVNDEWMKRQRSDQYAIQNIVHTTLSQDYNQRVLHTDA